MGAAFVTPLAMALLRTAFPGAASGRAMGFFVGLSGIAVLCGPLLGGAIVQGLSWPWIFWVNVPIAAVLLPLVLTRIPESRGPAVAIDWPGLVGITAAAFALAWGLVRAGSAGWASLQVWPALLAGLILLGAFTVWERRADAALLPMRMFRSRVFSAGNLAIFFFWASGLGSLFFMAQFLQTGLRYDPLQTGLRLMPWGATTFFAAQLGGALTDRVGARALVVGSLVLQGASMLAIGAIAGYGLGYPAMIAPLVLSGTGVATASATIQACVIGAVEPHDASKAAGTLNTVRQLGGVFGVAVMAVAFAARGGYGSAPAFTDGFIAAVITCAALALLGALAGLALSPRRA